MGSTDTYLSLQQPSTFLKFKNQFKDIIFYPIQWLIVIIFGVSWVLLTFFLKVENCKLGYLGAGI